MNFTNSGPSGTIAKVNDDIFFYEIPTPTPAAAALVAPAGTKGETTARRNNNTATKNNINALMRQDAPGYLLPEGYEPTALDICCGRGKRNWNHSGNVSFRNLIQSCSDEYMTAPTKNDKTAIVFKIVEGMRVEGCKFLKQVVTAASQPESAGRWMEIGDAQAREKVGHSLRDQVTAFNRQNKKLAGIVDQQNLIHLSSLSSSGGSGHHSHTRRPSLALSDSGNEGEQRRVTLDSTELISGFARRPSWVAGQESGSERMEQNHQYHQQQQQEPLRMDSLRSSEIMSLPQPGRPERRRSSYEYMEKFDFFLANPDMDVFLSDRSNNAFLSERSNMFLSERSNAPLVQGVGTDVMDVQVPDPISSVSPNAEDAALFRSSIQTWDPKISATSGNSSILSVRRSVMSGGTTLRRMTNSLRMSNMSMTELMADGDLTASDLAMYFDD